MVNRAGLSACPHLESNMVEVEIIGMVITAQYGTLNTGDVLRTNAEFAKHLVEEAKAARYRADRPADEAEPDLEPESGAHADPEPEAAVRRRRGK
jgi:hypothetical protein